MAATIKSIIEMREKRANLLHQARDLHNKAVEENRDMSADEQRQYDGFMGEMDGLKSKIDREERLMNEEKEMEKRDGLVGGDGAGNPEQRTDDKQSQYKEEFRNFLIGGIEAVSPEKRGLFTEMRGTSPQSAGSNAAGGYTVPQGFYNDIIQAMKTFGGMRNVARVMPTSSGNPLMIPTANNTAQVGRILSENSQIVTSDVSFGQTSLAAYKYTSDLILVPIELIQDSAFDVESYVKGIIADRIARITNTHFTVGDGSAKPLGIVNSAVLGKTGVTGQTTSVVVDDLIDLEHSIDPVYRSQAQFMFHDSTLKALKKLKDTMGRFLWSPGLTVNAPDSILGYGYTINQDMPTMAANAKSILFGKLASYWIRDVMDVQLVRFGEKYMDFAQVGFTAFSRHDGKFINGGGNEIVYYANSAT